jgi:FeS assembly SUF system protein
MAQPEPQTTSTSTAPEGTAASFADLAPDAARTAELQPAIVEAISTVFDPEIPVNIFDLGLVYTIEISPESDVAIAMSLTAPGCPVAGEMPGWVAEAVSAVPGVRHVDVELVWEPQWGMDMMSDEARLELGFM